VGKKVLGQHLQLRQVLLRPYDLRVRKGDLEDQGSEDLILVTTIAKGVPRGALFRWGAGVPAFSPGFSLDFVGRKVGIGHFQFFSRFFPHFCWKKCWNSPIASFSFNYFREKVVQKAVYSQKTVFCLCKIGKHIGKKLFFRKKQVFA
jgi:hypothetical protein